MSPITHGLVGWMVASAARLNRRERVMVTVAGVVPDLDGFGIVAEIATGHAAQPLTWWSDYHHVLGHNLGFALLVTALAASFASRRALVASLVFLSFHLHLLGDVMGGRGPEGEQWPIPYLLPFSGAWTWTWTGQWALNAWQNLVITAGLLGTTTWLAWRNGFSPLEILSSRADHAFIRTLRTRFGNPRQEMLTRP